MKKKCLIISISIILLISLITILINKNSKEYIVRDGIMLALTLDGEKIYSYPKGNNYSVEINCENGKGKWLVDEWKLSIEEITGDVICNIYFTSNPKTLLSEVETINVNNNYNSHGYRYSGSNPNNYIWFNNEMWRIIGSIPTCLSATCGSNTTNLVKIIKNESIGGLAYDAKSSGYTNVWGNNTLYTLLNSYYYGVSNGTETIYCYGYSNKSKSKCDYSKNGINPTGYYGKMIKNVYWNTGGSAYGVTPSVMYTNEIVTRTVLGYIGLMNASDYGYAADSSYHNTNMSGYNTTAITSTNWLYGKSSYSWTNTSYTNTSSQISSTAEGKLTSTVANSGLDIIPTLYLDSSVYIVSGDGTEGNPYQIGM